MGNAVKYRSEPLPVVHVAVELQEGEWLFLVHDNGIEINLKDAERIFATFQRLHTWEEK